MEVGAFGGEGVFGAGWDFGVAAAGDDAVFFEVVEALGEGAGVDGTDGFFPGEIEAASQGELPRPGSSVVSFAVCI